MFILVFPAELDVLIWALWLLGCELSGRRRIGIGVGNSVIGALLLGVDGLVHYNCKDGL